MFNQIVYYLRFLNTLNILSVFLTPKVEIINTLQISSYFIQLYLEKIQLYKNNIGSDGCLALIEANWTKISAINFGNYISTKAIII